MRFFVIDSIAFESIQKQVEYVHPDMIEILPGLMPKVIRKICSQSRIPVIAGGFDYGIRKIYGGFRGRSYFHIHHKPESLVYVN